MHEHERGAVAHKHQLAVQTSDVRAAAIALQS